jgi:hypothetical protein
MIVEIDDVLWQFAKLYRKKLNAEHPDLDIADATVAMLRAFAASGDAVEGRAAGVSTWRATPKFLDATGLPRGPTV